MRKKKIKVVDSGMGTYKTSTAIRYINNLSGETNVLFVTPFLTECRRIAEGCPDKDFTEPSSEKFGTKSRHFKWLIGNECNIVCTHALFTYIDDEVLDLLRVGNYILILDEVLDVVSEYDIFKYIDHEIDLKDKNQCVANDLHSLTELGCVTVDEDFSVHWSDKEVTFLKYYENMKNLCDKNSIYYVNNRTLFWAFPTEVFDDDIFEDIFILTYLFEYQTQACYFRFHNIPYEYYHVDLKGLYPKFVPTLDLEHERAWKDSFKDLITICDSDRLNKIGKPFVSGNNCERYSTLGYNWYKQHPEEHEEVGRCIYNFLRKAPPETHMYTTFKEFNRKACSRRISINAFVSLNARATNDYAGRTQCAYMINRYMHPALKDLFESRGIEVDEDKYALAEMVQWVWRSAIRNGEPINLYIPSLRMRTLFKQWLNNEEIHFERFKSRYF